MQYLIYHQKLIFLLLGGSILLAAPFAVAAAVDVFPLITCAVHTGQGPGIPGQLSPMTPICTICDLFLLLQKSFQFIWLYLSIPIAAVMMLYGGFLMLLSSFQGESSSQVSRGRKVLFNAVIGLAIVFLAWIGVDSILKIVGARYGTDIQQLGPWNQIKCTAPIIPIIGGPVDVIPIELQCPTGQTEKWVDGSNVRDSAVQRAIVTYSSERGEALGSKGVAGSSCQPQALAPYETFIRNESARTNVPVNRLRGIILIESAGNPRSIGPAGEIGLMQLKIGTARSIVPELSGRSSDFVATWLRDPANNIHAGALYYKSVLQSSTVNGNTDRALRGYNGGAAANLPSANCKGVTRAECLWDDNAHQIPNERPGHPGYASARNYVKWIHGCEAKMPGA
jgi:hypothetical protein